MACGVPDVRRTVENWFESGEMAAWNVRVTGTHTGTGQERAWKPCTRVATWVG